MYKFTNLTKTYFFIKLLNQQLYKNYFSRKIYFFKNEASFKLQKFYKNIQIINFTIYIEN